VSSCLDPGRDDAAGLERTLIATLQGLRSLRNVVLLFVLLPLLGILVAVGMLGLRELEEQMTRRLQDDIELVARSIRLPIAAAMVRADTEAVQEALDSVFQIDQLR